MSLEALFRVRGDTGRREGGVCHLLFIKWLGVAGATGAVARAAWQPHHATNWSARAAHTRQDHSRSTTFWPSSARSCPSQFPQHHRSLPAACFPPTRTSQWLFEGWGRAGRGAGEPGPASGVASLAGPPRRVVPDEAAMQSPRTSPAPCLRHPPG